MNRKSGKVKILLCASVMLCASMMNVYAEDFTSVVGIDLDNFIITYKGVCGSVPTKIVNAVVVEGENEPDGENVVGIGSVLTGENGEYNGNFFRRGISYAR